MVKSYQESNGEIRWEVSVVCRSVKVRHIRVTKRRKNIVSEAEARRIENKLRREAERELVGKEINSLSWLNLVDGWELSLRKTSGFDRSNLSASTAAEYVGVLRKYTHCWYSKRASEISRADIVEILRQAQADGKSATRMKAIKSSIDHVFQWAIDEGKIENISSPATEVRIPASKDGQKLPEVLSAQQCKDFLAKAKVQDHPWYPVWAVALSTGMRSGELYALEWDCVDLDAGVIRVHRSYNFATKQIGPTKGRNWRVVPISSELMVLLKELRLARNKESVLPRFNYWARGEAAQILRMFLRENNLPSVRFHALRASWTTMLLSQGVPFIKVMKMGGWNDLDTMQIYARIAGVDERGATECLDVLPKANGGENVLSISDVQVQS